MRNEKQGCLAMNRNIYDYAPGKPYSAGQVINASSSRHIGYYATFREAIAACQKCHQETNCTTTSVSGPGFYSLHSAWEWQELLDWMDTRQKGDRS